MGEMKYAYKILIGNPEKNHAEHLDVDGNMILERMLGKWCGKFWTGFIWLRGSCEYGNEPSVSIRSGDFLD
jgi:hypothetical protein